MIEEATSALVRVVESNPWMAPLAAFAGGLLTAANPCVLAMVPLMVGYIAGQEARGPGRSFLISLMFSLGLTAMFAVMFLATWAVSSILRASWWTYIAAAVCLLMGLHLMDVIQFRADGLRGRASAAAGVGQKRQGLIGAVLLGLLFGLVSLPCAGPMLAAVLAITSVKGAAFGGTLLVAYSLGHCGLVLAGGTSMGLVQHMIDSKGWNRGTMILRRVAGVLIIGVGIWLLMG